jgi:hypothetical protein
MPGQHLPQPGHAPPRAASASASAAEISAEDVRRDIEDLGWHACSVGSVISIRAGASRAPLAAIAPSSASSLPKPAVVGKRKQRKCGTRCFAGEVAIKRREKLMVDLLTLSSVQDMSDDVQGEGGVASSAVVV